jgi:peptidyl-prolyl cis-trans isomerase B (cyclophilin B)
LNTIGFLRSDVKSRSAGSGAKSYRFWLDTISVCGGTGNPMSFLRRADLRKIVIGVLMALMLTAGGPVWAANPRVKLETTQGVLVIELTPRLAPRTVDNFLQYVEDGFYDGTLFHRVIKGFMIQGGGLTETMERKPTRPPIENEAANGLKNRRGSIAMARTGDPHSATAQFFINTMDNPSLDFREKSVQGWGYCVFGRVVQGMEVVDAIEAVKTGRRAGRQDVPLEPVILRRASVVTP